MRVVRDRRDARWLPSRFHFAAFRLYAYGRLLTAAPQVAPGTVLTVDSDQTAFEHFIVAGSAVLVVASLAATLLAATIPLAIAFVLALPLSAFLIQIPLVFTGAVIAPLFRAAGMPARHNMLLNAVVVMSCVIAAACLLAVSSSPLRFVGIAFITLAAVNALAAVVVLSLQRQIAELERRRFGIES